MNILLVVLFLTFFSNLASATFNQLAFSGGGAFGAVEIGILKRINELNPKKYNMYTGISAGGLNAGFLSFYDDLSVGVKRAETLYSDMRNFKVYKLLPETDVSIFNTEPLFDTLTTVINKMPNKPVIKTLIGATNLYTGKLDVFQFDIKNAADQVKILMSTSAIPVVFPPITYNNYMYADGGTLSNELLDINHVNDYLNITYITPGSQLEENDTPITSIKDMIIRSFQIVSSNYNNPYSKINQVCDKPYGEINNYFVDSKYFADYNMLNFDDGQELVDIGYKYMSHQKINLC
jgi:predicted patatin/cPLA2 family phospholipase